MIELKWVLKVKYQSDGLVTIFKAKLVAQRFTKYKRSIFWTPSHQ